MTRRERLERKLEQRLEWADKASARAESRFSSAARIADQIPLGQPILVGHHSERHARRDAEKIHNGMAKGVEEQKLAQHHAAKADGLERQLETCIFSDDSDAVQKLEQRIAENEAEREEMKTINRLYKKGDKAGLEKFGLDIDKLHERMESLPSFNRQPFPSYSLTNLGARIRSDKQRLDQVKAQAARAEKAQAAGGVTIEGAEYVCVTFAEKPEREILDALKAAGFRWSSGSWYGKRDCLPSAIVA